MVDNIKKWSKIVLIGLLVVFLFVVFRYLKFSPLKFIGWLRGLLKPPVTEQNPEKADKTGSQTIEKSVADTNNNAGKIADNTISNIDKLLEEMQK